MNKESGGVGSKLDFPPQRGWALIVSLFAALSPPPETKDHRNPACPPRRMPNGLRRAVSHRPLKGIGFRHPDVAHRHHGAPRRRARRCVDHGWAAVPNQCGRLADAPIVQLLCGRSPRRRLRRPPGPRESIRWWRCERCKSVTLPPCPPQGAAAGWLPRFKHLTGRTRCRCAGQARYNRDLVAERKAGRLASQGSTAIQ